MIDRYAKNEGIAKNVLTKRVLKLKLCLWKDPHLFTRISLSYGTEQLHSYLNWCQRVYRFLPG